MIEIIRSPVIRSLYTTATGDESALQYPLPDQLFGFCVQQSCEKLLKAWLTAHNRRYPFTHELLKLAELLEAEFSELLPPLPFPLKNLQPFAVEQRYDSTIRFLDTDRALIRETVAALRVHTLTRILALERS